MKNLLILFGGQSSEHEISCKSAVSVIKHINRNIFNVLVVGITRKGEWFLTEAIGSEILNGSWEKLNQNLPVILSSNRAFKGLMVKKMMYGNILILIAFFR